YPALGFFIVGLLFIVLAILFSKPSQLVPVTIVGKLQISGDPSNVTLTVEPDPDNVLTTTPDFDGTVNKTLWARPEVARLRVTINASGYQPQQVHLTPPIKKGQSALPSPSDLKFTKAPSATPQPSENIPQLPANVNPPPVQEAKGFKSL